MALSDDLPSHSSSCLCQLNYWRQKYELAERNCCESEQKREEAEQKLDEALRSRCRFEKMRERCSEQESEISELQERNVALEIENKAARARLADKQSRNLQPRQQLGPLSDDQFQADTIESPSHSAQQKAEQFKKELFEAQSAIAEAQERKAELEAHAAEAEKERADSLDRIHSLTSQLDGLQKELSDLQKNNYDAQSRLEKRLLKELSDLQKNNDDAQSRLEILEALDRFKDKAASACISRGTSDADVALQDALFVAITEEGFQGKWGVTSRILYHFNKNTGKLGDQVCREGANVFACNAINKLAMTRMR